MKKKLFLCLLLVVSLLITKNAYAETYDGEYSIEYLLKNYSVVTLGQKDAYTEKNTDYHGYPYNKGELNNSAWNSITIDGAVLVSGNVDNRNGNYYSLTIGSNAGTTKSYIKGDISNGVTISSQVTDSNYFDFNKMYVETMKVSQTLADNTEYFINSKDLEVSKPGIYTIQNTAMLKDTNNSNYYVRNNTLLINNYDSDSLYVFNYYNEFVNVNTLPGIMILESDSSKAVNLSEYINSGKYTGNIIFNFPNAKIIDMEYESSYFGLSFYCYDQPACESFNASIIAPNADVLIGKTLNYEFYGTIIANSIHTSSTIKRASYKLDKKIVDAKSYIVNHKDFSDDFYSRDYSIKDLLENYSLITLGHKDISSKAKLANLTNRNGSVRLFHITGQALINGDIIYDDESVTAFDLQSNKATESYINGKNYRNQESYNPQYGGYTVIQPWDNMDSDTTKYIYQKNILFLQSDTSYTTNEQGIYTAGISNYINFDRLYDNVVAEQKGIDKGKKLEPDKDGVLHIPTGGAYYIEDISMVKEVIFDNFDKNENELTIITIENEGDINFPLISKDGDEYKGIVTNDYFGKEKATHLYELDTFISEDSYYGNIVWNLPNADFIQLREDAPFAGHMIAPNADVETPELHFAGCFIVNSIYGEGNTEAHFYPIKSNYKCVGNVYDGLSETQKRHFDDYRLRKTLGGDNTIIEKEIIGDKDQYNKDVELFESLIAKCENREIIINPETAGTIGLLFGIVVIALSVLTIRKKKYNKQ